MVNIKGRYILITGAANGIGKGIAESFGKTGDLVFITDNDIGKGKKVASDIIRNGGKAEFFYLDVSEIDSIGNVVAAIISKYKKIDVLVNNAGICPTEPFDRIDLDQWDHVIRTNLTSAFFLIKETSKYMIERRYGKIINISSVSAKMGGVTAPPHYVASKGGLDSLTRYFAKNLAKFNINVNAVSCATTKTNLIKSWEKSIIEYLLTITPLNRMSTVSDIANAVIFLASDNASFITGEVLNVNGGLYMD